MTEPEGQTRYDEIAEGYARYWGPVIRPAAEGVLDWAAPAIEAGAQRVIDIGTGTGTLAIEALERWPHLEVTGIDSSAGMLELARRDADRRLGHRASGFATRVARADELPYDDGAFDLAISSFVLQLVPNRAAAFREARRVLRAGGSMAWVTWLRSDGRFAGDRVADEVLDEAGFDPPEPDPRSGDLPSAEAAGTAMRRAGFRTVHTHVMEVAHVWTVDDYVAFLTEFDEATLFAELRRDERRRIVGRLRSRLRELAPAELTIRMPIVYVVGRAG